MSLSNSAQCLFCNDILQKVSAERSFGRRLRFGGGAVRGEIFGEVLGKIFGEVLGHCFAGTFRAKKLQLKLQLKSASALRSKLAKTQGKTSWRGSAGGPLPKWDVGLMAQLTVLPMTSWFKHCSSLAIRWRPTVDSSRDRGASSHAHSVLSSSWLSPFVRDKFLHKGFCTSTIRTWGRILGNEVWMPEFRTRIFGSSFLILFSSKRAPQKNAPSRNSPLKNHLPKFNPEISGWHFVTNILPERFRGHKFISLLSQCEECGKGSGDKF